jgi:mRNA interferase YafQ
MYKIVVSKQFEKDFKLAKKRGLDLTRLETVVNLLASGKVLPKRYRDHSLGGNYRDFRECHIRPDWLLIYRIEKDELMLFLFRTGSHSDLF